MAIVNANAASDPAPLPQLTRDAMELFALWIREQGDVARIAQRTGRWPHEVIDDLRAEPLAAYIDAAEEHNDRALRRRGLNRLAHVMETAPGHAEQRRAACDLIRGLDRRTPHAPARREGPRAEGRRATQARESHTSARSEPPAPDVAHNEATLPAKPSRPTGSPARATPGPTAAPGEAHGQSDAMAGLPDAEGHAAPEPDDLDDPYADLDAAALDREVARLERLLAAAEATPGFPPQYAAAVRRSLQRARDRPALLHAP